jgi:hypothetical protein
MRIGYSLLIGMLWALLPSAASTADPFAPTLEQLRELTRAEQARLRSDLSATIAREMRVERTKRLESEHFVLLTDVRSPRLPRRLLDRLESTYLQLDALLRTPHLAPAESEKLWIHLLGEPADYQRVLSRMQRLRWSAGFYHPIGLVALHGRWAAEDHLVACAAHELTHWMIDRRVTQTGVTLPRWLEEGFADYVGHGDIRRHTLLPGRHRERWAGRFYDPSSDRFLLVPSAAELDGETFKRDMREGRAHSIADLIDADASTFYGNERRVYYQQAWLLVEFLNQPNHGWPESAFASLLTRVGRGEPTSQVFLEEFGIPLELLEQRFRRFVERF